MDKDIPLLAIFYLLSWRVGPLKYKTTRQGRGIVAYTYWNELEEA